MRAPAAVRGIRAVIDGSRVSGIIMVESSFAASQIGIPWPRSRLLGRSDELAFARATLLEEAAPLLSLTGPGGVGKTRLALAIAHEVGEAFADGVIWVDLAPVSDPELAPSAILAAIGVASPAEQPGVLALIHHLRMRQCLLLLDNCEHLIAAAADLASALLASCPALQCLATSRAPLRIRGEVECVVEPLPLPALAGELPEDLGRNEAVALFVERSRAVRPGFALTNENAASVTALCRRLDGLPLAIELAAARSRILSPEALLAQMTDRLRLLRGGNRDSPPRQQTMEATIAWSYALLDAEERTLFQRLAVFVDGCDLDAAVAVSGQGSTRTIDGLSSLREQQLLRITEGQDDELRYGMLETIREYAQAQLQEPTEEAAIREAHASYFLNLAEVADVRMQGPDQAKWRRRIDTEYGNVLAALEWFMAQGDAQRAWRLVGALWIYWKLHNNFVEGTRRLELALALPGERRTTTWARARTALGYMIYQDFRTTTAYSDAQEMLEEALEVWHELGDQHGIAMALEELMAIHFNLGDFARAWACGEDALAIYRALADDYGIFNSLWILGVVSLKAGDLARSRAELHEAIEIANQLAPDLPGLPRRYLAWLMAAEGDLARACEMMEELLDESRGDEREWFTAGPLDDIGWLSLQLDDRARAASAFAEELAVGARVRDDWYTARGVLGLAVVAWQMGQAERAAILLGVADGIAHLEYLDNDVTTYFLLTYEHMVESLRGELGGLALKEARLVGRMLPRPQAIAQALAEADVPVTSLDRDAMEIVSIFERLTAREAEVLRLVARRLTDGEIADALFISRRTVGSHVMHILEKLGANNRREAGALAARMGLA
jgi:predicted ATPase/DNA-binding CsgD family transcriptional regulator